MRIWCSPSGYGLVKSRRLVTRSSILPHQGSGWCTCIRGWKNWAASIGQTSLSMLDRIGLPTLLNRSKHHLRCPGQNGAGSCVTTIWHGRNHDPNPTPSSLVRSCSLRAELPQDTVVTNGAGNYTAWLHRHHRYCAPGSQLAPTSGSMGYRQRLPPSCYSPSALQSHFPAMAVS